MHDLAHLHLRPRAHPLHATPFSTTCLYNTHVIRGLLFRGNHGWAESSEVSADDTQLQLLCDDGLPLCGPHNGLGNAGGMVRFVRLASFASDAALCANLYREAVPKFTTCALVMKHLHAAGILVF